MTNKKLDDLIREISDSKLSDFKMGQIDGLKLATDMLKDYLVEYPGFVDPKHKFDKFKKMCIIQAYFKKGRGYVMKIITKQGKEFELSDVLLYSVNKNHNELNLF